MPEFASGPPLLLSAGVIAPALLAVVLSAAAFVAIVGYVLRSVSRETGESQLVLIARLRAQLLATLARAQARWQAGAVGALWSTSRRQMLRTVVTVLGVEALVVLGVVTGSTSFLGAFGVPFAATLMGVACLLANAAMFLLWLAGPKEATDEPLYAHNGQEVNTTVRMPFAAPRQVSSPPEAK